MKPWYLATEREVTNFFDVNPSIGLSQKGVLARLKKFGPNSDLQLNPKMEFIYKAWVRRQSRTERVTLQHVVPGDIVFLEPGGRVPADIRLLHVNGLKINQSVLTGDALPSAKNTFALAKESPSSDQKCMAFAGSFVTSGSGWGIAVACANHTTQNILLLKTKRKKVVSNGFAHRKLSRLGVIVNNKKAVKLLNNVNMVFVDAILPDKEIHELIHKVQLGLGIPCVFCLDTSTANRLKIELPGAQIYQGSKIVDHVPKQILSMMIDTQFITDASYDSLLKIVGTMQQHGSEILWFSDGKNESQVIGAASVSMIMGDISRDDNLFKADLVVPHSNSLVLSRILHNKK